MNPNLLVAILAGALLGHVGFDVLAQTVERENVSPLTLSLLWAAGVMAIGWLFLSLVGRRQS